MDNNKGKTMFDSEGQLDIGQPAPDFNLPSVDGRNYSLEDFRGKVKALVVIFSCNHCPYVIKTEDRMIELGKTYIDKGVGFVLICANDAVRYPQDRFSEMKKRARQKGYPFPYLRDETQDVTRAYGAQVTPHVFLFDSDLVLRYRGAIDDNMELERRQTREYLKLAIEALLSGEAGKISDVKTRAVGCSVKWKM